MAKKEPNNKKRSHPLPWIAGILLLLGAAVLGGLYWDRTSRIETVEFAGYESVDPDYLKSHINIPTGIHPDSLNVDAIINQFKKIRYVENVQLKMRPGGTMVVDISERQPVALLINGSEWCYVDSNGVKLPLNVPAAQALPILYGFKVQPLADTLASAGFKQVSKFLQQLQQNQASDATISEVAWNDEKGVVALTNNSGVKLIFGKEHYKQRLRNWVAFYTQVIRHKGIERFQSVDLSFNGQVITHENEKPNNN